MTYYTLPPLESPDSSWMTRSQRSRRRDKGLLHSVASQIMITRNTSMFILLKQSQMYRCTEASCRDKSKEKIIDVTSQIYSNKVDIIVNYEDNKFFEKTKQLIRQETHEIRLRELRECYRNTETHPSMNVISCLTLSLQLLISDQYLYCSVITRPSTSLSLLSRTLPLNYPFQSSLTTNQPSGLQVISASARPQMLSDSAFHR